MVKSWTKKAKGYYQHFNFFKVFTYLFLIIISYVFIFPFIYMVSSPPLPNT